jgi:hypothetical protein
MSTKVIPRADGPSSATAYSTGQDAFLKNWPLSTALTSVPSHARLSFERGWRQEYRDWFDRPVDFIGLDRTK